MALGNHGQGVAIIDTPDNTVGGATPEARNVISGNGNDGVFVWKSRSSGNVVQGNYIGTDASGVAPLGNATGVNLIDAPDNLIGGSIRDFAARCDDFSLEMLNAVERQPTASRVSELPEVRR